MLNLYLKAFNPEEIEEIKEGRYTGKIWDDKLKSSKRIVEDGGPEQEDEQYPDEPEENDIQEEIKYANRKKFLKLTPEQQEEERAFKVYNKALASAMFGSGAMMKEKAFEVAMKL